MSNISQVLTKCKDHTLCDHPTTILIMICKVKHKTFRQQQIKESVLKDREKTQRQGRFAARSILSLSLPKYVNICMGKTSEMACVNDCST